MQYDLFFTNPVFHKGLNATVRDSDAWMVVHIGDLLTLKKAGKQSNPPVALGTVVGKAYIPFTIIPESWLACEHDPSCRTLGGLFAALVTVYPHFSMRDHVTVLLFTV